MVSILRTDWCSGLSYAVDSAAGRTDEDSATRWMFVDILLQRKPNVDCPAHNRESRLLHYTLHGNLQVVHKLVS